MLKFGIDFEWITEFRSTHRSRKTRSRDPEGLQKEDNLTALQSNSEDTKKEKVLSPMPGTFYAAPTPEDDNYVKVGDNVKKGQTLCIIEAMKIMNEIESDVDGVLSEIKVDNGNPVEYNQVLLLLILYKV